MYKRWCCNKLSDENIECGQDVRGGENKYGKPTVPPSEISMILVLFLNCLK